MYTTKIIEKLSRKHFKNSISDKKIKVSNHAFDHLSSAQREVYTKDKLTNTLSRETPNFVGLQKNGRYSAYYKQKEGFLNLIVGVDNKSSKIITFMNKDNLPRLG